MEFIRHDTRLDGHDIQSYTPAGGARGRVALDFNGCKNQGDALFYTEWSIEEATLISRMLMLAVADAQLEV